MYTADHFGHKKRLFKCVLRGTYLLSSLIVPGNWLVWWLSTIYLSLYSLRVDKMTTSLNISMDSVREGTAEMERFANAFDKCTMK